MTEPNAKTFSMWTRRMQRDIEITKKQWDRFPSDKTNHIFTQKQQYCICQKRMTEASKKTNKCERRSQDEKQIP
jgi:hypothetical protein